MAAKKQTPETPHLATARKWRPQVFGDIVGQPHVATTLRNAVAAGRPHHAYLFSGPRGVGKTTTARILARAINCLHPNNADPDNTCEICREIIEGRSVNVFEIDGASNRGVDEIRNLRDAVRYGPPRGKYKVYIIDEVHMLTKEAFNALLKTLEEPPAWVVFIFATTEVHRVPPTILSRCQRFEFRRIATAEIAASLEAIAATEKIVIEPAALDLVARRADGSLRDSQSMFDQVVAFGGAKIGVEDVRSMLKIVDDEFYFRVTEAITAKNAGAGFTIVEEVSRSGCDLREFAGGLAEHFRNLLVVRSTGDTALVDGSERVKKRCAETAARFAEADLVRLMKIASDTEAAMRWSQQPRLKLELALQLMVAMDPSVEIGQLLSGIEELKKGGGRSAAPGQDAGSQGAAPQGAVPPRAASPAGGPAAGMPAVAPQSKPPIRGTVKATQPTLRPDQVVPPAPAPQGMASVSSSVLASMITVSADPDRPAAASVTSAPVMAPAVAAVPLVTDDGVAIPASPIVAAGGWANQWRQIVDHVRKEKIAVGSMLAETVFHTAEGNNIRIACPDDFHADLLRRNRQYISALAEKVYGLRVQFESILASFPDGAAAGGTANAGSASGGAAGAPGDAVRDADSGDAAAPERLREHPLVKALIREFKAEEIR